VGKVVPCMLLLHVMCLLDLQNPTGTCGHTFLHSARLALASCFAAIEDAVRFDLQLHGADSTKSKVLALLVFAVRAQCRNDPGAWDAPRGQNKTTPENLRPSRAHKPRGVRHRVSTPRRPRTEFLVGEKIRSARGSGTDFRGFS
jgi:hypothetical protein